MKGDRALEFWFKRQVFRANFLSIGSVSKRFKKMKFLCILATISFALVRHRYKSSKVRKQVVSKMYLQYTGMDYLTVRKCIFCTAKKTEIFGQLNYGSVRTHNL